MDAYTELFDDGSQLTFSGKITQPPQARLKRSRKHLRPDEVEQLIEAAGKASRNGLRDQLLILIMFRHGLRVSETARLLWDDVNFGAGEIFIRRAKGSISGTHPIYDREIRGLKKLQKNTLTSPYVFTTSFGNTLTTNSIYKIIRHAGELAKIPLPVNPHMLRHSTGYYLVNKGVDLRTIQAYLGHKSIQSTVLYTELAADRFKNLWQ